jgi:hypothetical protein
MVGGKWYVWVRGEVHTGVWLKNLREKGQLQDLGGNGSVTVIIKIEETAAWTRFIRLQ